MNTDLKIQEIKEKLRNNIGRTATYISKDFSRDKVKGEQKEAIVKILNVYDRFATIRFIINGSNLYYDSSVLYADLLTGKDILKF